MTTINHHHIFNLQKKTDVGSTTYGFGDGKVMINNVDKYDWDDFFDGSVDLNEDKTVVRKLISDLLEWGIDSYI